MLVAVVDCDPADAAATGIPIEWFRSQVAGCKAAFKLLILDACHAGSEKAAVATQSIAAQDLGAPLEDLERVVTIASSQANERSHLWDSKKQSLFSYCFIPLRKGNEYQIRVENKCGGPAMMRLLVDGLNTLPHNTFSKAMRIFGGRLMLFSPNRRIATSFALVVVFVVTLATSPSCRTDEPKRWAVLIGVNDYSYARGLKYCVADQSALNEPLLAAGFDQRQVTLVVDQSADQRLRPTKTTDSKTIRVVSASQEVSSTEYENG